ncbi:hypothetical protein PI124_g4055 [Phytophthora idaei]|nr:hypothetical protein PI125_g2028 [Phytophthora idaei]KAG3168496.1 hypothetical protein PI126_g3271 [Phytophthora idaei]KAG3251343.1 hypothetical protein PI124_g4055 [Phytophthora idaei]
MRSLATLLPVACQENEGGRPAEVDISNQQPCQIQIQQLRLQMEQLKDGLAKKINTAVEEALAARDIPLKNSVVKELQQQLDNDVEKMNSELHNLLTPKVQKIEDTFTEVMREDVAETFSSYDERFRNMEQTLETLSVTISKLAKLVKGFQRAPRIKKTVCLCATRGWCAQVI